MYRQILVSLDGSKFAEAALPWALSLARKARARVHLVGVVEPIPAALAFEEWDAAARAWSEDYLASTAEKLAGRGAGEVTTALRSGHVIEALLHEAGKSHADIMVMATHGRGALSRAWLGSVADTIIRQASLPVLFVRPRERDPVEVGARAVPAKILVALDGSEFSEDALAHAIEMGVLFDSQYHLTRVVAYPLEPGSPYLPYTLDLGFNVLDEAKESASQYLEEHAVRMRRQGLRVTTSVIVDGQAAHGILSDADAASCDMIAMASHGRSVVRRLVLGSTADKVLRGTHVPLLLHRPAPIERRSPRPGRRAEPAIRGT